MKWSQKWNRKGIQSNAFRFHVHVLHLSREIRMSKKAFYCDYILKSNIDWMENLISYRDFIEALIFKTLFVFR